MDLTPPQQRAIAWEEGPMRLVGAAGTGKSEVLARRLVRLAEKGDGPERIVVISSTREAAQRLRGRAEALLSGSYEELWIGTWEEIVERLLREHSEAGGLDPFFDVVGRAERLAMLLDRLDDLPLRSGDAIRGNPTGLLARLLERIDSLKAGAEPPEPELAELCAAHDRILADAGSIDSGDLFLILNRLLDEHAGARAEIASRFTHLMVDELEESTAAQRAILISLARDNPNQVVAATEPGPAAATRSPSSRSSAGRRCASGAAPTSAPRPRPSPATSSTCSPPGPRRTRSAS